MVYAHTMSMKIYEKGSVAPSVTLRAGEVVFDRDGYLRTVAWVALGKWGSTDGFTHEGFAFTALDVTDHPVVRCELVDILKEKGAL